ncbi:Uma2 family endonuclease [Streptomyces sp. NPDC046887]|uniref:Uma2 family endonuclease n=1 Tax=Streptomyces sp. NPDC046887 TaxID=3155472 RepID=UPI0033E73D6E
MTGTDGAPVAARLSRFEDAFPGFRSQIVAGSFLLTPVKPFDGATIHTLWDQLAAQLPEGWECVSDVAVPFDEDDEFCPDLALLPAAEVARNLIAYPPELIELAAEVVSPGTAHLDYEVKDQAYARRGIPNYLVLDPYRAHCVTRWNPGPDGYRGQDTIPYGGKVTVDTRIGRLTIDTADLPVDPGARS